MDMEIKFYEEINEFYELVLEFLVNREAENILLIAILNTIKVNPSRYGEDKPILITVTEIEEIKLITLRTPPYNLVLSFTDDLESVTALTKELLKRNMELPGVVGFKAGAEKFAKLWCNSKNLQLNLLRNERIFKLQKVAKETLGKRQLVVGDKSNQKLILNWAKEFMLEVLSESDEAHIKRTQNAIIEEIKKDKIFLLIEEGEVVSMARKAGKTPNGNLVNLVYTPLHLRNQGYATECVAKLSQKLLEEGNNFCFLFTDLMNPTSNSIYQKIGYRPVIDVDEYKFFSK
ncbi:hypothetical protein LCGC14_0939270 [marine sediment metagenome]|uniref:N-acetyltransferase domain-containing protein n=1 Tax=marine sediment metagenome TaxID=412755 RepID=A0A0F9R467_9ZZZZ